MDLFKNLFSSKKESKEIIMQKRLASLQVNTPISMIFNPDKGRKESFGEIPVKKEEIKESKPEIKIELKLESKQSTVKDEVVIVNEFKKKKHEEFYKKKYASKLAELKLSNTIIVDKEKFKKTFDVDTIDCLFQDLTLVFNTKVKEIDTNQIIINKGINESKELISLLYEMYSDSSINYNFETNKKIEKITYDIKGLESEIGSLESQIDILLSESEKIEKIVEEI